jgi:cyclic-di-AMP phosphodiesterase PgpH
LSKRPDQKKKRSRAQILWKRWGEPRKLAVAVLTGLFIAALLIVPLLPDKVSVQEGDVARELIQAPRSATYRSESRRAFLQRLVAEQVAPIYSNVFGADALAREAAAEFFYAIERVRFQAPDAPLEQQVRMLQRQAPDVTPALLRVALSIPPKEVGAARAAAELLVDEAMKQPILPESLSRVRAEVRVRAAQSPPDAALAGLAPPVRTLVGEVAALFVTQNQVFDEQETEAARRREMERVPVQYESIGQNDILIQPGETVTKEHLAKLNAVGLRRERPDVVTVLSLALLAFGLVACFCAYLYQFHPVVFRSFRELLLLAVVVCGSLLLFRIGSTALGLRFSGDQLGFLGMLCSALGAMLIAALLCPQIAVFVGVALAILTSVLVGSELRFAILSIVSSLAAVQAVTNIRDRAGILRACLTVSGVNVFTALVAQGATQAGLPEQIGQNALWAVIGGFASVLLWVLFTAWLERPFRLTTPLTLLELSDPSHPLLRRLAMEAPGTYAHSIIVGNLSEAAAEAIGADGLFCRVASYYHDVGKVMRPHFFVENQLGENRHNAINPSLSSLVITSHVKDGVELAEEYRLPPPIIAIIREHHGTCLIKYFYHQAVTSGGEENTSALEYQFRYEGPRPQTKESGIIMLADSAEAASRTLEKPTPGRIRDLIERIVRDRLADGQLDECELTFKDLEKIIASMTRSLTSLLHARVDYPSGSTASLRKAGTDGAAGKQPLEVRKALADTPETASATLNRPPGF